MSLYHIISISIRKKPGDHAYHLLESFESESTKFAHERHLGCRVRCTVLRDGSTGRRYSVADSRNHLAGCLRVQAVEEQQAPHVEAHPSSPPSITPGAHSLIPRCDNCWWGLEDTDTHTFCGRPNSMATGWNPRWAKCEEFGPLTPQAEQGGDGPGKD